MKGYDFVLVFVLDVEVFGVVFVEKVVVVEVFDLGCDGVYFGGEGC